eukprot:UN15578
MLCIFYQTNSGLVFVVLKMTKQTKIMFRRVMDVLKMGIICMDYTHNTNRSLISLFSISKNYLAFICNVVRVCILYKVRKIS